MSTQGTYRQFDHTGDIGIEAEAPDESSLYACCAAALFDILAGPGPVAVRAAREFALSAPDREILMVRWLRELLYAHDTERWIFGAFDVETSAGEGGARALRGIARGERFDPSRHALRTEIKAVTYHQLAVARTPEGTWRARIVFDI